MTDAAFAIPARAHLSASRSAQPRHSPRRKQGLVLPHWLAGLSRRAMRRPLRTMLYAGMAGIGCLIVVNALVMQSKRHPAPWGLSLSQESTKPLPDEAMPPMPPVRPAALDAARELGLDPKTALRPPAAAPAPVAAPARPVQREQARETARDPAYDPIAELIRGDSRPPANVRQAETAKPAPQRANTARKPQRAE